MNAFGTAIGVDKAVSDHMRLGIAAGYGYTDVKSKAAGSPSTDINSWQGAIYAGYDARTKQEQARMHQETGRLRTPVCRNFYYVDSLFAFTQNNYDTRRNVFLGDTTRTAKGEYNGQQYSTSIEAGYTMNLKGTGALEITPFTTLDYAFLYLHDYTEKGADALNLHVEGEGYNLLTQGWGMKFAYPFRTKKHGTYIPSLRAAWVFDYLTDKFSSIVLCGRRNVLHDERRGAGPERAPARFRDGVPQPRAFHADGQLRPRDPRRVHLEHLLRDAAVRILAPSIARLSRARRRALPFMLV